MKRIRLITSLLIAGFFIPSLTFANADSTGLPGDHFSLQGALEMFRQSNSVEEFEKLLNTEDKYVNNLDLNGDGETDYVKVIAKREGDVHLFILQVPVSESESQDIAVLELEKTGDTTAILQIIGDEMIYGEQVIVEASDEGDEEEVEQTPGNGPSAYSIYPPRIIVNVFYWPAVRFVYRPVYAPWVSPWRWRYYPVWWKPWRPLGWHVFHPYHVGYRAHCAVVRTHRVVVAHRIYTPYRVSSVTVRTRNTVARNNYSVSRTTRTTRVTTPGGNTHVRRTTTTSVNRRSGQPGVNGNANNNGEGDRKKEGRGGRRGRRG